MKVLGNKKNKLPIVEQLFRIGRQDCCVPHSRIRQIHRTKKISSNNSTKIAILFVNAGGQRTLYLYYVTEQKENGVCSRANLPTRHYTTVLTDNTAILSATKLTLTQMHTACFKLVIQLQRSKCYQLLIMFFLVRLRDNSIFNF